MKTRVSVIIPIYNVQEFLEECLDSVLAQTINSMELTDGYERNLQVILVDDGSTDNSADIAKQYANNYDNFEYVYEKNQGLGHARNYGCEFADGDYIIFLDSDDLVTHEAYERMYKAAIRNDSDMVIGDVLRFSSNGYHKVNIHHIAFSGSKDVTHITESPELFYDTTSWNKLIKHSFWDKHEFKFPEGILYEDIPVTIPMHFLANNVSIIYEPCYLWRIREGLSKSITQTTDDTKNLIDRITVMDMVDEFYKNNVKDSELTKVKDIKWLKIDIMIFINKLKSSSEEDSKEIRNLIRKYINEHIDHDNFKYLNEIEKLKYDFLLNDEFDKLIKLLNFELEDLKSTNIYSNNSHIMMNVDEEIFKESPFCIDKFVRTGKKTKYLQKVSLRKEELIVKGFTIIPGLEDSSFNDREYEIFLINSETHKKMPLSFSNVETGNISSFNIKYGDKISYNSSGYEVKIPYSKLINNPDFIGQNRIRITFKQDDIVYSYFAGAAKKNVQRTSKNKARIYEDTYFSIDYDLYRQLIFNIKPVKHTFDNVFIENDELCIASDYVDDLFICYDKGSSVGEFKVPIDYNSNKKCYSIKIEDISQFKGQIRYENNEPIIHSDKKVLFLPADSGQIIINALRDYYFDIIKYDNISIISDIIEDKGTVKINLNLFSKYEDASNFDSAVIYFKDRKTYEKNIISNGKLLKDNSIEFNFSLSDENIVKNLYQGVHDIFVEYTYDDTVFSMPVYLFKQYNYRHSGESFDYKLYRSGESKLRVRSTRKWSLKEDTKIKRINNSQKNYKFFRSFPINKKRIMFESMWGSKYSCNPRYLYEYIDEHYPEYECIWSFNDEHTPIKGNGIRVRRKSLKYYYYLATSKFFVNNVNFEENYVKREGQIEIQTMHGTPLKTLGIDVPGDFKTKKEEDDFLKKCSRWDYLTVQSDYVSDISSKCFAFNKKFLNYGYPRTDLLYSDNNEEDIKKLKSKLDLPLDKKIILYAPTWREMNNFELMLDLDSLKKSLSDEYILILRLHHLSFKNWSFTPDEFVYDLSRYDSIEELYLISDILVTDYSSVMFDYANLDRPIILFTYDLKEYHEKLRGFYMDIIENRPGPLVYTSKELEDTILNIEDVEKKTNAFRQKFRDKFLQYELENSSEKVFNEVMKDNNAKSSILNNISDKIASRFIK